jgi:hypothetical protein
VFSLAVRSATLAVAYKFLLDSSSILAVCSLIILLCYSILADLSESAAACSAIIAEFSAIFDVLS